MELAENPMPYHRIIDTTYGPMPVLFENRDIIALSKPHGLHTVEDRHKREVQTLRSILDDIYGKIFMVHRLDAGTGGVIVCAKSPRIHSLLCQEFENNRIKKQYRALVKGCFTESQTLSLPISSKIAHGKYKINFKSGRPAITTFMVSSFNSAASLLTVTPFTGRTHQIRVHLKALKHPLYRDWVYNEKIPDHRLTLFAEVLSINLPHTGEITLKAPLSNFMKEWIEHTNLS